MSGTGSEAKSNWQLDRRWGRRGRSAAASDERKPLAGSKIPSKGTRFLAIEIHDIAGERHANQLSKAAVSGPEAANAGIDPKDGRITGPGGCRA
jgi:hypothetical protein